MLAETFVIELRKILIHSPSQMYTSVKKKFNSFSSLLYGVGQNKCPNTCMLLRRNVFRVFCYQNALYWLTNYVFFSGRLFLYARPLPVHNYCISQNYTCHEWYSKKKSILWKFFVTWKMVILMLELHFLTKQMKFSYTFGLEAVFLRGFYFSVLFMCCKDVIRRGSLALRSP